MSAPSPLSRATSRVVMVCWDCKAEIEAKDAETVLRLAAALGWQRAPRYYELVDEIVERWVCVLDSHTE